ncbi:MAG: cell wall hydrolase [Ruminococcaceae bacterium]|nr:cell wall hydrolase [Oscillospiraceae bacterium]
MKKTFVLTLILTMIITSFGTFAKEGLIKLGSSDKEVAAVQKILINNGYLSTPYTGYFGSDTHKALKSFQSDNDLTADGIVGDKTRGVLYGYDILKTYTDEDVYWLSRLIEAEAGGESYKGKLAVGNSVLSRVLSTEFPNNVVKVIFDRKYAVQYEPTSNGAIYNTPSNDSILAAISALEGVWHISDCLYFFNPRTATNNWISKNREFHSTIGNHDFYY